VTADYPVLQLRGRDRREQAEGSRECYDLAQPRRLWSDQADTGFWSWPRHADTILMSAELELAAWDLAGRKLWTTFVEPPWEYAAEAGTVLLDVMGKKSCFPLTTGPTMAT
jgi:hypothetical protein